MSEHAVTLNPKAAGALLRAERKQRGIKSLDQLARMIEETGRERPSIAKLSRIETGEQPVPADLLTVLETLTGVAPDQMRPDLAAPFRQREDAA